MKHCLFVYFFLLPLILSAQTKMVTRETPKENLVEKYSVLSSDKNIKEGEYKSYRSYLNRITSEGFYKNNQRDSSWKFYALSGEVQLQGSYKNDKRVGIWNAYVRGQVQVQYDYTNKTLLFFKPLLTDSTKKYHVINGTDTTRTLLDRIPVYLDGIGRFTSQISLRIKYPDRARNAKANGFVVIGFTITADGQRTNYRVISSTGNGYGEAALAAVKETPGQWLPGILNGKPVAVEYVMPFKFNLLADITIN